MRTFILSYSCVALLTIAAIVLAEVRGPDVSGPAGDGAGQRSQLKDLSTAVTEASWQGDRESDIAISPATVAADPVQAVPEAKVARRVKHTNRDEATSPVQRTRHDVRK